MEGKNVVQDPFNSELIGVIENEVRKLGYFLMLYASDKADEIQKMAITWNVDGIISLGLNASECRKMKENLKIPLVFIDCYFQDDDESYTNVGLKDRECATVVEGFGGVDAKAPVGLERVVVETAYAGRHGQRSRSTDVVTTSGLDNQAFHEIVGVGLKGCRGKGYEDEYLFDHESLAMR